MNSTTLPARPTPRSAYERYLRAFSEEERARVLFRLGIGSSRAVAEARERRRIAEDNLEAVRS